MLVIDGADASLETPEDAEGFSDLAVEIDENLFDLDLPDDVEVREMALGDATP